MNKYVLSICVALLSCISSVCISAEILTKQVTLDTFMQGNVLGNIPVPVFLPASFEPVQLEKANFGYSYWMNPSDVDSANTSGELPEQNGFMYGKLSPNVAYVAQKDFFIGLEEPESIERAKSQFPELVLERYRYGPYAVALLSFSSPDKKTFVYAMYIATNIDTNVVYVALRPPANNTEVGEQVWEKLKTSLEKVSK